MANVKTLFLVFIAFGQLQCARSGLQEQPQAASFDTNLEPASPSFSLVWAQSVLNLTFAERSSSAIILAEISAPASAQTPFVMGAVSYLDRISDLPAVDALFGAHLFFAEGGNRHLFYVDRKADEQTILKHIQWRSEAGNPLIDVLPFSGRPLWAFRSDDGTMEVLYEKDRQLCRQSVRGPSACEILLGPFDPAGEVSILNGRGLGGFTAFDRISQRLILFLRSGASIAQYPVARFGMVHSSAAADDGMVNILAFDQQHSRIVLFQQSHPGSEFQEQLLAPGREVGCLGIFFYRGLPFYLYSERAEPSDQKNPYRFSLLAPESGGRTPRYRRHILCSGPAPFLSFRTVVAEDWLYLAYLQRSVRLLRLDLRNYLRIESD